MTTRRIGILGGTFDPIHLGHLETASVAETALGLAEVLFIPSHIPPHRGMPSASSHHRFAMVALAIARRPGWRASDLELREPVPSYTAFTLRRLHALGFQPRELFFIIGADAFAEIVSWKDYPGILDYANFAVVSRPGRRVEEIRPRLPELRSRMLVAKTGQAEWESPLIFLIDAPTPDVSSSAIRQQLLKGGSVAGLVTPAVQQHIAQHGLYREMAPDEDPGKMGIGPAAGRLHG
jgi:nicotinate-nucleotide adenylyltransferase